MPTLGEELKRRREERKISLADISEATRIGTRFLKAIESDNYSILPGGIFTRSFIRAYAKQVGLNEDEAVARYQLQVTGQAAESQSQQPPSQSQPEQVVRQIAPPEKHPRKHEPLTYRQSSATRTSWPTIIIGVGILVFVGLIVWALVQKFGSHETELAATPEPAQQVQQTTTPEPAPSATNAEQSTATEPPPGPPPGDSIAVKLEAVTGSWVQYKIDDGKPASMIIKPGQSLDLPVAQSQIKLSYGNRLTLKISINSRQAIFPPDTPEKDGHVIISRDNLQTFFP